MQQSKGEGTSGTAVTVELQGSGSRGGWSQNLSLSAVLRLRSAGCRGADQAEMEPREAAALRRCEPPVLGHFACILQRPSIE